MGEGGRGLSVEDALRLLSALGVSEGYEEYLKAASGGVRVGFVVNPIAGMGGRVGLKGTDGADVLRRAVELGARPVAPRRAVEMLRALRRHAPPITLYTYAEEMGEAEALEAGFSPRVVGRIGSRPTTAEDTKRAVREFCKIPVDLIVFVGGDGTARDVFESNHAGVPVLGVPAGVKMHSAVFATSPEAAARAVARFALTGLPVKMAEVMDVDEEAFRRGRLSAKLYGYLPVIYEPSLIQGVKRGTLVDEERLAQVEVARRVVASMRPGVAYVLGPGTTVKAVADLLGVEKSLLGVDVVIDGRVVELDADEGRILRAIEGREAVVVVTPIGGQGFILGRGNQQISPEVVRRVGKGGLLVIATSRKLRSLDALRVDTGDAGLDAELRGTIRVLTELGEVEARLE
ncbi:MAG: ATP-NAD kinase family protein [Candidatus Nezhaarchaeales archaeon]